MLHSLRPHTRVGQKGSRQIHVGTPRCAIAVQARLIDEPRLIGRGFDRFLDAGGQRETGLLAGLAA